MELSLPLIASKGRVTASIKIKEDGFVLSMVFPSYKNSHTFKDEKAMFNYLKNIGLEPNDFKLAPF